MMTMSSVVQQQEQQVLAISKSNGGHLDNTDSSSNLSPSSGLSNDASHNNSTSSSRALPGKQLSVVLPGNATLPNQQHHHHQKSLVTPTIVTTTSDQAASSPGHLFSSLAVQLAGQEVSLFTGLPSCTPTSADGLAAAAANLTSINPFFWGVHTSNQEEASEQQQQQVSDISINDGVKQRRQLGKLQLDQLQQSAMILSPLSFLLSPEQEAWLRIGGSNLNQQQQQQQHPLSAAAIGTVEHPIQSQQQQQQTSQQQHRLTAQDLTNHHQHQATTSYQQARPTHSYQPAGSYNTQISPTSNINQRPPSSTTTRCNTLNLQLQRAPPAPPEMGQQPVAGGEPPVAHHQNQFTQQPSVLVMSSKGPSGGEFCPQATQPQPQQQQQAPVRPSLNTPTGQQPPPMIATLHYDGLHYDPHLQQLYLAQHHHQDIYHHQVYPQMAATTTYQPQTYATTQDTPLSQPEPIVETIRPAPVIVMETSPSPHHQFNITSASNSSARSSVSRDTTINVEALGQNGSPTSKVSQQLDIKTAKLPTTAAAEPTEVVVKKKSKGGRKKKQVTHEELMARKNRSKERNRVAAKRCRQKRKQFLDELRDRIDNLSDSNKRVLKENTMLKSELELLRKHHKTCRIISQ